MQRLMLKSKIHRALVTATFLDYEGSIAIDPDLLAAADILPGEQVHVLNVNSGARIVTYVIPGTPSSGEIMLNGPAARAAQVGDPVVIITYAPMTDNEARAHVPRVVLVDAHNRPRRVKGAAGQPDPRPAKAALAAKSAQKARSRKA